MRQLTDVEVREFFAAYRAMEATARRLEAIARAITKQRCGTLCSAI